MNLTEVVAILGLKSTDPQVSAFFEKCALGAPPKLITANQGSKYVKDKAHEIEYKFSFDITNDHYYPPVSPKNDEYKFECFISSISLFNRKKKNATLPREFWSGHPDPDFSVDEYMKYFGLATVEPIARKKLDNDSELVVWFDEKKQQISAMEARLIEQHELLSQYELRPNNEYNTVKQAYLLLVKWLFDQQYLVLPEAVYKNDPGTDDESIRHFVQEHLKNHVWDNQLNQGRELTSFLYQLTHNSSYETKDGRRVTIYMKHLFLQEAGVWEKRQKLYDKDINKCDAFEKTVQLDARQKEAFLKRLTTEYKDFKENRIAK